MNKEQLDKIDKFYQNDHQKNLENLENTNMLPTNSNLAPEHLPSKTEEGHWFNESKGFKSLEEEKKSKWKYSTVTRWDKFQPYAFNKLS